MLSSLSLNNVALIKKQEVVFEKGFNCILGQSGAGKSIIIDALDFSMGAKADKNLIRSGESSLRVDAIFENISPEQKQLLESFEIDCDDDQVIVTRTLSIEGKSSIKINGYPATAKLLKDFAFGAIDFCGQHDSVGLLAPSNHLSLLDKFAGKEVEEKKLKLGALCDEMALLKKSMSNFGGSEEERERRKDILQFQITEIENANLQADEEDELKEKFAFISASESIYEKVGIALDKLDAQRENVSTLLHESKAALASLSNFKEIEDLRTRLENSYYEIKDIVGGLEDAKAGAEFDPLELERIDSRLDLIKALKKKYGADVPSVLSFLEKAKQELALMEESAFELEKLEGKIASKEKEILQVCEDISSARKQSACILEEKLMSELSDLEMKGTAFSVSFEKVAYGRKGFDNVKFMFSANKGQDVKDLHKTASGGELSRLLLAFKNVMLGQEGVGTVVFDEIDSGISGHTAGRLAEKLSNISKYTQIICITHTPVVAAKADCFWYVEKTVKEDNTYSIVSRLDEEKSVLEVARLIDGGKDISQTAIEHAKILFAK